MIGSPSRSSWLCAPGQCRKTVLLRYADISSATDVDGPQSDACHAMRRLVPCAAVPSYLPLQFAAVTCQIGIAGAGADLTMLLVYTRVTLSAPLSYYADADSVQADVLVAPELNFACVLFVCLTCYDGLLSRSAGSCPFCHLPNALYPLGPSQLLLTLFPPGTLKKPRVSSRLVSSHMYAKIFSAIGHRRL